MLTPTINQKPKPVIPLFPRFPLPHGGEFVRIGEKNGAKEQLLQHLPSYLGFSFLGRGLSLHGCSSKAQLLLLP